MSAYVFADPAEAARYLDAQEAAFESAGPASVECFDADGRVVRTIAAGAVARRLDDRTLESTGSVMFDGGSSSEFESFIEPQCRNVVFGGPLIDLADLMVDLDC